MQSFHIKLTKAQASKLQKGQTFQVSPNQMLGGAMAGLTHEADLHVADKHAKAMSRAIAKGKSYRLSADKISGGKLSLSSIVKDPLVKAVAKKVVNGAISKFEKKGTISSKESAIAKDIAGSVIEGKLKEAHKKALVAVGGNIKSFAKGSQEAKDFMAKVRSNIKPKAVEGGKILGQKNQEFWRDFKTGFVRGFSGTAKAIAPIIPEVLFASAVGGAPAVSALLTQKVNTAGMRYLQKNGISKEQVALANELVKSHNARKISGGKLKKINFKALRNLGVDVLKATVSGTAGAVVGTATGNPLAGMVTSGVVSHYTGPQLDKLKSKGGSFKPLGGSMLPLGSGFIPVG